MDDGPATALAMPTTDADVDTCAAEDGVFVSDMPPTSDEGGMVNAWDKNAISSLEGPAIAVAPSPPPLSVDFFLAFFGFSSGLRM